MTLNSFDFQYSKTKVFIYAYTNKTYLEQNRICPWFIPGLFTRRGGGGGGGGGWVGGANPSICTKIGLLAHFLCARGLPFSQVMYKPIIVF